MAGIRTSRSPSPQTCVVSLLNTKVSVQAVLWIQIPTEFEIGSVRLFWPNLDPDRGYVINFAKKLLK